MNRIPSVKQYRQAFGKISMSDCDRKMLRAHYRASRRTLTTGQMGKAMGWRGKAANRYGILGKKLRPLLNCKPELSVGVLCRFETTEDRITWVMHDNVARALEQLDLV